MNNYFLFVLQNNKKIKHAFVVLFNFLIFSKAQNYNRCTWTFLGH